jgi:hypothetical protein
MRKKESGSIEHLVGDAQQRRGADWKVVEERLSTQSCRLSIRRDRFVGEVESGVARHVIGRLGTTRTTSLQHTSTRSSFQGMYVHKWWILI